jgi:hypothetical protein
MVNNGQQPRQQTNNEYAHDSCEKCTEEQAETPAKPLARSEKRTNMHMITTDSNHRFVKNQQTCKIHCMKMSAKSVKI